MVVIDDEVAEALDLYLEMIYFKVKIILQLSRGDICVANHKAPLQMV